MIESDSNALRLAQAHFNRMDFAGTPATATMRAALSKLLVDLDANIGLSKFVRLFPFIGGTAATHALELFGNDITWAGTVTHDANGSRGNGTTGVGTFPLNCFTEFGNTNGSASAYVGAMTDTGGTSANVFGSYEGASGGSRLYMGNLSNSMAWGPMMTTGTTEIIPPSSSPGTVEPQFLAGSFTTAKLSEGYKNGVSLGTSTPTGVIPGGASMALMAAYNNDTTTPASYSDAQLAFVHFGTNMTDAEHLALYNAVEAFQTTLGRQN